MLAIGRNKKKPERYNPPRTNITYIYIYEMKVNNLLTTTTTYLFIVVLIIFTTTSTCAEKKKKKNSKTYLVLDIEDYIQITDWFSRYASTVDHKQW